MCQPSCRASVSRTAYSTTDRPNSACSAFSSASSSRPCSAASVRQPCARTSTASSAIGIGPPPHVAPSIPACRNRQRVQLLRTLSIGVRTHREEPSMPLALLALAISAFAIGTTEFVPTGLLPGIAEDLGVDIPAAGLLFSVYSLGVLSLVPLLTAAATPLRP